MRNLYKRLPSPSCLLAICKKKKKRQESKLILKHDWIDMSYLEVRQVYFNFEPNKINGMEQYFL